MSPSDPTAVLALAASPRDIPLSPSARRRARVVEVRLDLVPRDRWAHRVREVERAFPAARLLATVRLDRDGGRWPADTDRTAALEEILSIPGWDALDLEADAPDLEPLLETARRRAPDLRLVISRHSFKPVDVEEMQEQIEDVARFADRQGAHVAKWAGCPTDLEECGPDLVRLLSRWSAKARAAIFPMGPQAEPWRVACALVPGGWGYGHDGTGAVAPGQLPWQVFDALLGSLPASDRWDERWFDGVRKATALALREESP
jgi:3-dehydroquinate dehydratase I